MRTTSTESGVVFQLDDYDEFLTIKAPDAEDYKTTHTVRLKFDDIKSLVADYVRRERIAAIEHATPEELFAADKKLSSWIIVEGCSVRVYKGTDPEQVKNRVAFASKNARVREIPYTDPDSDWAKWKRLDKNSYDDSGVYLESRKYCDDELVLMGYEL
jgi:hypothetical protein